MCFRDFKVTFVFSFYRTVCFYLHKRVIRSETNLSIYNTLVFQGRLRLFNIVKKLSWLYTQKLILTIVIRQFGRKHDGN